jgi:hypothetical protein
MQVDAVFKETQAPFEATKPEGRRNFLNCASHAEVFIALLLLFCV